MIMQHHLLKSLQRYLIVCIFVPSTAFSAMFQLPDEGNNVVGELQHVIAAQGDTLVDIARQFDVGYLDIVSANPGIDPWLIKKDTHVLIPTQYILPDAPWEGVIVNIAEMRLYYFPPKMADERGTVLTFPIGIGRNNWPTPQGQFKVLDKIVDPVWTAPSAVIREHAREGNPIAAVIPPGPDNPLGKFAITLDKPGYLIHGTNKPFSIGRRVSHGCLRLYPEDIEQLIYRISRGEKVKIEDESIKVGKINNTLYIKAQDFANPDDPISSQALKSFLHKTVLNYSTSNRLALEKIIHIINLKDGITRPVQYAHQQQSAGKQDLYLRLGPSMDSYDERYVADHLKSLSLDVSQFGCSTVTYCLKVGPISNVGFRNAVAKYIKHGLGISTYNDNTDTNIQKLTEK